MSDDDMDLMYDEDEVEIPSDDNDNEDNYEYSYEPMTCYPYSAEGNGQVMIVDRYCRGYRYFHSRTGKCTERRHDKI